MKNTCSAILAILLLALLVSPGLAIESKFRLRLYKKTIHEIIEKNGVLLSDYTTVPLGSVDVADIAMKDAHMEIIPGSGSFEDFESDLNFIEGTGAEIALNDFKFTLTGQVEGTDSKLEGSIEKIFLRIVVQKQKEDKKSGSTTIPEFDIEDFKVTFDESTIAWTIGGEDRSGDELKAKTIEWLNQAIEGQLVAVKILINSAQKKLTDYINENMSMFEFSGNLDFSEIVFYENYLELVVSAQYPTEEFEGYKLRDTESLLREAGNEDNAVEVFFDENLINTGLYTAFELDSGFGLRKTMRIDEPDNEYGAMFDSIMMSQVVGQGWKELTQEYGENKR